MERPRSYDRGLLSSLYHGCIHPGNGTGWCGADREALDPGNARGDNGADHTRAARLVEMFRANFGQFRESVSPEVAAVL